METTTWWVQDMETGGYSTWWVPYGYNMVGTYGYNIWKLQTHPKES